jgi:D-alanyl-D-alanine carboxypeptidase/D-alanyl-D-alanine-endopeptidase (penicillin-binding protein 4)
VRACRLLLVIALASIPTRAAMSQVAEPTPDDTDEAAGSGSGAKLAAPADPKARGPWLRAQATAALAAHPKLAGAPFTVAAIDLSTNEELLAIDADRGMNLASNTKLLTSIAALETLGAGFRWRTTVVGDPPDEHGAVKTLVVRGRGDPLLSEADLRQLAADVAARGVRSVDELALDATYFDDVTEPPHFADAPKETAGYRAPVASFGIDRGTVTVTVVADPDGGATVTLAPDAPDAVALKKVEVASVTTGRTRLRVDAKPAHGKLELDVTGKIRAGEGSWDVRKRLDDPARVAMDVFRRELVAHGVSVKSKRVERLPAPPTAKVLATHESTALDEILRAMNKHSDNYVAESLLKTIGAETRATPGSATWDDGLAAVRAQLAKLGLPAAGYKYENGSGLYASTNVSARQLVTLLRAAHRDYRIGPTLVASLPVGGVDGTLASRWHGHPAAGRVRAKTGTLDKVVTLAGYVAVDTGHVIAFAVLANDIPAGQRNEVRAAANEIVDALAAYVGAQ